MMHNQMYSESLNRFQQGLHPPFTIYKSDDCTSFPQPLFWPHTRQSLFLGSCTWGPGPRGPVHTARPSQALSVHVTAPSPRVPGTTSEQSTNRTVSMYNTTDNPVSHSHSGQANIYIPGSTSSPCPQNALGHSAWSREWWTWLNWRRLDFNLTKLKEMVVLTICSFNILIVHILQKYMTMWTHC